MGCVVEASGLAVSDGGKWIGFNFSYYPELDNADTVLGYHLGGFRGPLATAHERVWLPCYPILNARVPDTWSLSTVTWL